VADFGRCGSHDFLLKFIQQRLHFSSSWSGANFGFLWSRFVAQNVTIPWDLFSTVTRFAVWPPAAADIVTIPGFYFIFKFLLLWASQIDPRWQQSLNKRFTVFGFENLNKNAGQTRNDSGVLVINADGDLSAEIFPPVKFVSCKSAVFIQVPSEKKTTSKIRCLFLQRSGSE
jgi:hypothetical protein